MQASLCAGNAPTLGLPGTSLGLSLSPPGHPRASPLPLIGQHLPLYPAPCSPVIGRRRGGCHVECRAVGSGRKGSSRDESPRTKPKCTRHSPVGDTGCSAQSDELPFVKRFREGGGTWSASLDRIQSPPKPHKGAATSAEGDPEQAKWQKAAWHREEVALLQGRIERQRQLAEEQLALEKQADARSEEHQRHAERWAAKASAASDEEERERCHSMRLFHSHHAERYTRVVEERAECAREHEKRALSLARRICWHQEQCMLAEEGARKLHQWGARGSSGGGEEDSWSVWREGEKEEGPSQAKKRGSLGGRVPVAPRAEESGDVEEASEEACTPVSDDESAVNDDESAVNDDESAVNADESAVNEEEVEEPEGYALPDDMYLRNQRLLRERMRQALSHPKTQTEDNPKDPPSRLMRHVADNTQEHSAGVPEASPLDPSFQEPSCGEREKAPNPMVVELRRLAAQRMREEKEEKREEERRRAIEAETREEIGEVIERRREWVESEREVSEEMRRQSQALFSQFQGFESVLKGGDGDVSWKIGESKLRIKTLDYLEALSARLSYLGHHKAATKVAVRRLRLDPQSVRACALVLGAVARTEDSHVRQGGVQYAVSRLVHLAPVSPSVQLLLHCLPAVNPSCPEAFPTLSLALSALSHHPHFEGEEEDKEDRGGGEGEEDTAELISILLWLRAKAQWHKGEFKKGLEDAELSIELLSWDPEPYFVASLCHLSMGSVGEAVESVNVCCALHPGKRRYSVHSVWCKACAALREGFYQRALCLASEGLHLVGEGEGDEMNLLRGHLHFVRSVAFLQTGNKRQAVVEAQESIRAIHSDPHAASQAHSIITKAALGLGEFLLAWQSRVEALLLEREHGRRKDA